MRVDPYLDIENAKYMKHKPQATVTAKPRSAVQIIHRIVKYERHKIKRWTTLTLPCVCGCKLYIN